MKQPLRRLLAGLTLTTALTAAGLTIDIVATPQDTAWGAPASDTGWGTPPADTTSVTGSATVTTLMDTAWG